MNDIKRIEIVIDVAHTPMLLKELRAAGAAGYTVVRDVHGMGDRGERSGDELTNLFRNSMVVVASPVEQTEAVIEAIRPLLERYGGMCLVSDAQWIRH